MPSKRRAPGLYKRGKNWHIDKIIGGLRIQTSCHTENLQEAQAYLAHLINQYGDVERYGKRIERTFITAATYYLNTSEKKTIDDDAYLLPKLVEHIGNIPLHKINTETLKPYIIARQAEGVKNSTINHGLQVVQHILNLAAERWIDETGNTWLESAPKIEKLKVKDARKPYQLSWQEQQCLIQELPGHLVPMVLFALNTCCREAEICGLRWSWEVPIPEIKRSVFLIPEEFTKNGDDKLVVLNTVAHSIIEDRRGIHAEYVFTYKGRRIQKINQSAWRKAVARTGLPITVHHLRHTAGSRLRNAGVDEEMRADILGHRRKSMTTHYSAIQIHKLIEALEKIAKPSALETPTLLVLKRGRRN